MSYLTYPRLHFSGSFQAYPSTINNYTDNYNPAVYPSPEDLDKVALGWGPVGNGAFALESCVVTQIDYAEGDSATTPEQDPIIGQPVASIKKVNFPLPATIVDLDPQQQMVSEVWAMCVQIGGDDAYLKGDYAPAAFSNIWGQVQGSPPPSSTTYSATYQSSLHNISSNGLSSGSRFLEYFANNPASALSINFVVSAHNNNPQLYDFSAAGFTKLKAAGVPADVLTAIEPLQKFQQNFDEQGDPINPGQLPTKDFIVYILKKFLTIEQYNANIDTLLSVSKMSYKGYSSFDYTFGQISGTVGTNSANAPNYFVPNRMLNPVHQNKTPLYFTPFMVAADGKSISVNLSNSLATETPAGPFMTSALGTLTLVSFPGGTIDLTNAVEIDEIPYTNAGFVTKGGGFFDTVASSDVSATPLGIVSDVNGTKKILASENAEGYYLRADKYVFRMNPGVTTSAQNPRGNSADLNIHALKFGVPVPDGTGISLDFIPQSGDTPALGTPESALTFSNTAVTTNGIATFTLNASDPGNPRVYIDGQLYFLKYGFQASTISKSYVQNSTDFVSIQVYDQTTEAAADDVLAKFGRLYTIMGFLTDEKTVEQIDMRNMIKLLIEKPFDQVMHMPVSRDMSQSAQNKVTDWINSLNNA